MQCGGLHRSSMPTASLTVCPLVFNNHSTPNLIPHVHLLSPSTSSFSCLASGAQEVDKPASPPGGHHENVGKKTIPRHQPNELSCSVRVLTRPSSQVHPQRGQLALHGKTRLAYNLGFHFIYVWLLARKWIHQSNPIFHNFLKTPL